MRKNLRKLVLSKETLTNLDRVVGGKLAPLTNAYHICDTVQPCTGDCMSGQTCATEAPTYCDLISADC